MRRRTTIAQKLVATFILLSIIWCLLCAYGIHLLLTNDAANAKLIEQQAFVIANSKEIQLQTAMQSYSLASYMAAVSAGSLGDSKSQEALTQANQKVKLTIELLRAAIEHSEEALEKLDVMEGNNDQFAQLADQIIGLSQDNRVKAEVLMQTDARRLSTIIIQDANELTQQQQQLVKAQQLHNRENIEQSVGRMLWFAVLMLLASVAGGYYVSRKLTQPLVRIVGYTQQVARGNLHNEAWHLSSSDEIGVLYENFNR